MNVRISIGWLMLAVGLVAADFGIVRAVLEGPDVPAALAVTALPTINVLILAWPRARRPDGGASWRGFETAGWALVALFVGLGVAVPDAVFAPIVMIRDHGPFLAGDRLVAWTVTLTAVAYTAALLSLAGLGGWAWSRRGRSAREVPR